MYCFGGFYCRFLITLLYCLCCLCRNGIKRNAEVIYTMASEDQKQLEGDTSSVSRTSILLTARHHAALILNKNDSMAPDLQRSKTMVQALSPTVQLLKKDMMKEFEIVRQLEKDMEIGVQQVEKSPEQTKRPGRPKKNPTIVDKGHYPYTIAGQCDNTMFLRGASLCERCKGELFNLYFQCKGCYIKGENLLLCKICLSSKDSTQCPDDTTKKHNPKEKNHQAFDVNFRFHHFQESLGDCQWFENIQKALAIIRVDLLRTDPADDDDEKGSMSEERQYKLFVEKLLLKRNELSESLDKQSTKLRLPPYNTTEASELMQLEVEACDKTIDVWRHLLLKRELEQHTTGRGTKASYIFPRLFYPLYRDRGYKKRDRSGHQEFTDEWNLPNGETNPPCA
jgi:hypothetical protein